jgi:Sec-independent protein secretion pathway component TatC
VYVLVQVFALVVSPAGDSYSMLLLQVPSIVFGLACFALGRLSRGCPKTRIQ